MTDSALPGPGVCGHWSGAESRYCRSADGVRLYIPGHRCPAHTPAAVKGQPEPPERPGWGYGSRKETQA
ncbi:hypothetical protein ACIO6U_03890 [Streptomyces sp. NPDC087422]|uniref:hypothetical protein n=1 Tax=Streptomyces sp. NPDC087422 TaxID=3365786 RepID=UPI0037F3CC4D